MKMLLIGKTGQLGNHIYNSAHEDYEIFAPGKSELDVTDIKSLNAVVSKTKPDVIINTSAFHVVPLCETQPQEAFKVNAIAVRNLAKISKEYNTKLVTYSTDYVFDGTKGTPYVETDQPNPVQMYGISKLAGEYASISANPQGVYIIRTCGVYGGKKGSRSKKGNFVLNLLKDAKGKKSIEVGNEQTVNPTSAKDLALGTLKLIKKESPAGIYHLVNEGYCTWAEFAQEIIKNANYNTKVIKVNRSRENSSFKRPSFSALSNTKAKKLGIVLPSWQEGIKQYIMSFKP